MGNHFKYVPMFHPGDQVIYAQGGTEWYAEILSGPILVGRRRAGGPRTPGDRIKVIENTHRDRAHHAPMKAHYRFREVAERNLRPDEGE